MNLLCVVLTCLSCVQVGEYVILHVQSNFFMETFNYIVMSKGIILLAGQENMQNTIRTFAITLSAEMAPVATVVVYNIDRRSEVVADSLTFPVNGVSRNNVNCSLLTHTITFCNIWINLNCFFPFPVNVNCFVVFE